MFCSGFGFNMYASVLFSAKVDIFYSFKSKFSPANKSPRLVFNEIDENRAKAALHRAEERLRSKTPETDIARAETALQRAMARIQVLR